MTLRMAKEKEAMTLTITVYGIPGPMGSKRFLGVRGGKGIMVESSAKVKPWREAVKYAALEHLKGSVMLCACPIPGPLHVKMTFTLARPKSAPKSRVSPDRKPDLSKLIRSTEDALVDAGVIEDDARIVELDARKCFPHNDAGDILSSPGCVIEIRSMTPEAKL